MMPWRSVSSTRLPRPGIRLSGCVGIGQAPPLCLGGSQPSFHGCCWETFYNIFAYCGLVGNPHLTAKVNIVAPLPTSTKLFWFSGFSGGFHSAVKLVAGDLRTAQLWFSCWKIMIWRMGFIVVPLCNPIPTSSVVGFYHTFLVVLAYHPSSPFSHKSYVRWVIPCFFPVFRGTDLQRAGRPMAPGVAFAAPRRPRFFSSPGESVEAQQDPKRKTLFVH